MPTSRRNPIRGQLDPRHEPNALACPPHLPQKLDNIEGEMRRIACGLLRHTTFVETITIEIHVEIERELGVGP